MANYVDGYVLPVPREKLEAYRSMAQRAGEIWREYGALEYCEWVAEDVQPGKVTSFPQAVQLQDGETVIFAWITYSSKEQRDEINARVMKDPRLADMMDPATMPFDASRMFWGGFDKLVQLK
ncbi:DUF1428 domain-containing protein [Bowmanella dokdonensis]|uniref:DUF1428 domain-containing protein n=2 Tax=Bowmanella dokdonensis TaxID=751969 RepID=A0A939ILI9_9ALTE|nr:DUF1428 domain-containing protein [Bowmanella dokdonensis]